MNDEPQHSPDMEPTKGEADAMHDEYIISNPEAKREYEEKQKSKYRVW